MKLIHYNEEIYFESHFGSVEELLASLGSGNVNWIDVQISDQESIQKIGAEFGLHHLSVDYLLDVGSLPKFEAFDNYIMLSLKMLRYDLEADVLDFEHISIVLGKDFVITFQEELEHDVLGSVRDRLRAKFSRIRSFKADYLFYRLLDVIVDNYLVIIEQYRSQIEKLEVVALKSPSNRMIREILDYRKEIGQLRQNILPLKDEVGRLKNEHTPLINKATYIYIKDVYDHLVEVNFAFETFREMLKDIMDLHLTALSNNMNVVMKTLTVLSAVFIPLTFIVGVYGMNFKQMPFLENPNGYYITWGVMIGIALSSLLFMKYKRWF